MNLPYEHVLRTTDLHENGRTPAWTAVNDGEGYYKVGSGSEIRFTTNAKRMAVRVYSEWSGGANNRFGYVVNDGTTERVYWAAALPNQVGWHWLDIFIPGNGSKTVSLVTPGQHAGSAGGAPNGVMIERVRADAPLTAIAPTTSGNHLVVYGDSITVGAASLVQPLFGFSGLFKRPSADGGFDGRVTVVGHGFRRLQDDVATAGVYDATKAETFADSLAALGPTCILIAIGANDVLVGSWSSANFETGYTGLLNSLASASPSISSVPVICMSPLLTAAPNNRETNLAAIRTAVSDAVSATTKTNVSLLAGGAILAAGGLQDGIHPTTAGHVTVRDAIRTHAAAIPITGFSAP